MSRIVYLNGVYLHPQNASVSIDDRGFQFADSIYEVIALMGGKFIDLDAHLTRLFRSCQELCLPFSVKPNILKSISTELRRRNRLDNGLLYIQVTRGEAPRAHIFPKNSIPTLLMTLRPHVFEKLGDPLKPVAVITYPENRWARPDIKSTSLLANILAKQEAHKRQAYEAIYVTQEGLVSEGSHSNVWLINHREEIQTHPANHQILNGITRLRMIDILSHNNIKIREEPFSVHDLQQAQEVFLTGTTTLIKPISQIDGTKIHPLGKKSMIPFLRQKYFEYCGK